MCTGAREAAFRNIKTIAECLADELINAAKVSKSRAGGGGGWGHGDVTTVGTQRGHPRINLHPFNPPPSLPLSQGSSNSYAIKKKDELERVAKSNR